MGKRNRQRRNEKRRKRERQGRQRHATEAGNGSRRDHAFGGDGFTVDASGVPLVVAAAVEALTEGDTLGFDHVLDMLTAGPPAPGGRRLVDDEAFRQVVAAVQRAGPRGWSPPELIHVVRRRYGSRQVRIAVDALAAAATRSGADIDIERQEQLDELGARAWWPAGESYVEARADRDGASRRKTLGAVLEVISVLHRLPKIPDLRELSGPGPSRSRSHDDERMLAKIRALLAKAESTTFPDEAEALVAKAQELMTRHAVEIPDLDDGSDDRREGVRARRLLVDDPYADAKAVLVHVIASANRCRGVWSSDFGFMTLFGFDRALDMVELLFTSLLVQASQALTREGRSEPAARRRAFRRSFFMGYANRIATRLDEAAQATVADLDVESDGRLLPVLARRDAEVDAACARAFPDTAPMSVRTSDERGWWAGVVAGELASLSVHAEVDEPDASTPIRSSV
ncbi:MAG: DUF2786 domain-containing protein [Actinobacteria bacterium]|nr:DUF2786 domain-containing protein [Actinomycetota bacterium]